ncbi:MAG TPA: hypothetical protein VJ866_17385 [Pyrinomonadaceae bacterium]|nr:hypothetical protein [Pyrinomonadaceae bacterium]
MRTTRINLLLGLGLLVAFAVACNFSASTANISELKLGKGQGATPEATSFAASDTVYAVATVSNVPDKVKVRGVLSFEDVEGEQKGPIPGLEKTLDLPGSGTASYTFTPPPSGWPKGKYKIDVYLLDDGGQQKDTKSATFTVS